MLSTAHEQVTLKAAAFLNKMRGGQSCLGAGITFSDPTVTEALCRFLDFVWIDMEHNPLSLDMVQAHVIATKATDAIPLVRVAGNDPILIKPVLDLGAYGIVVPLVRSVQEARKAAEACRYPPEGIRGYGPRRPSNYGEVGGPEFCQAANAAMITILQIEHIDAVGCLQEILQVPGVTGIFVGPNDLAGSMGLMGQPTHPSVVRVSEDIISQAHQRGVLAGIAAGDDPKNIAYWRDKGAQWMTIGDDHSLMLSSVDRLMKAMKHQSEAGKPTASS